MLSVVVEEVKDMYLCSLVRIGHSESFGLKPDEDIKIHEMVVYMLKRVKKVTTLEELDALEESLGTDNLISPAIEHTRHRLKKKLLPEAWTKLSVLPKQLVDHLLGNTNPNVSKERNEKLRVLLSNYIAAASLNNIQTLASHWSEQHGGKNRLKYHNFAWNVLQKMWAIYQNGKTRPFFSLDELEGHGESLL